jgi:hypothetical protein
MTVTAVSPKLRHDTSLLSVTYPRWNAAMTPMTSQTMTTIPISLRMTPNVGARGPPDDAHWGEPEG